MWGGPQDKRTLQTCLLRLLWMWMIVIWLWKIIFTIRQPIEITIRIFMVELVEHRIPSWWMSLKELWCLPYYDGVALKAGWWLKWGHGTVSSEFCIQVVIGIYILQGLYKCDSDRLWMSDLNQILRLVPIEPHRYTRDMSGISLTTDID